MLISDLIHPQDSIYYTGAIVLQSLQTTGTITIDNLYVQMKEKYNMTFPMLLLSLDWLFLINAAIINKNGEVSLCS